MQLTAIARQARAALKRGDWPESIELASLLMGTQASQTGRIIRGQALLAQHEHARAKIDFDAAIQTQPDVASLRIRAAKANLGCGAIQAGFDELDAALRIDPTSVPALRLLSRAASHLGLCGVMGDAKERLFASDPTNALLAWELVVRYLNTGLVERAHPYVSAAMTVPATKDKLELLQCLLHTQQHDLARKLLGTIPLETSGLSCYAWIGLHIQAGDFSGAQHLIDLHRIQQPEVVIWSARLANWRGEAAEARAILQTVDTDSEHAATTRASTALLCEDWASAIAIASEVTSAFPQNGEAWSILVEAHRLTGNLEAANHALGEIRRISPILNLSTEINSLLLRVNQKHSKRRPTNALDIWLLIDVLLLASDDIRVPALAQVASGTPLTRADWSRWLTLTLAEMRGNRSDIPTQFNENTGDLALAPQTFLVRGSCARISPALVLLPQDALMKGYDHIEAFWGPNPLVYTYRAEVKMWTGHYAAAEQDLRAALELSERTRWAYSGLSLACALQGRPAEGLAALDDSKRILTPLVASLVYEAEMKYRLGDHAGAEKTALEAIEAHPYRISAWVLLALSRAALGNLALAQEHAKHAQSLAPPFWSQLIDETPDQPPEARWQHALAMMRGNRSSRFLTWYCQSGRMWHHYLGPWGPPEM